MSRRRTWEPLSAEQIQAIKVSLRSLITAKDNQGSPGSPSPIKVSPPIHLAYRRGQLVSILDAPGKVSWNGTIRSIQPRAWVSRYRVSNRNHSLMGYHLFLDDELAGKQQSFVVGISGRQQESGGFRLGDVVSGTGWSAKKSKREVADVYRAGALRRSAKADRPKNVMNLPPPYTGVVPSLETLAARGARQLDAKQWRTACRTCHFACQSRVEIMVDFDKNQIRRRTETFCYGPKSCRLYAMGKPRPVPSVYDEIPMDDDGTLDDALTCQRGDDE